jgi:hypothetical protein
MAYSNENRIKTVLEQEGLSRVELFGASFDGIHWDYPFRKPFKPLESDWLNVIATK